MRNVFAGPGVNLDYGIEKSFFYHSPTQFTDTNNLSAVTFIRHNGCRIMFPGDLECAGWKEFLKNTSFIDCLRKTSILIASHHGREGGYCSCRSPLIPLPLREYRRLPQSARRGLLLEVVGLLVHSPAHCRRRRHTRRRFHASDRYAEAATVSNLKQEFPTQSAFSTINPKAVTV